MLNKLNGRIAYAVLESGGFLGIGADYYPVPWEALKYNTELGGYVVAISGFDDAPRYPRKASPTGPIGIWRGSPPSLRPAGRSGNLNEGASFARPLRPSEGAALTASRARPMTSGQRLACFPRPSGSGASGARPVGPGTARSCGASMDAILPPAAQWASA
jgi:hypothetical protein